MTTENVFNTSTAYQTYPIDTKVKLLNGWIGTITTLSTACNDDDLSIIMANKPLNPGEGNYSYTVPMKDVAEVL
jgi:hypothetical protein